ncbi:hypothetical protein CYMTET_48516 [Cymbomonas tetramitiformis]|uniref:Uncharacterized protein n=1 Tax=Cymbomonas tetramitiformis TaxID=36881 RepID=A0AAE0BS91_9CHLO|nr:hypothetical protein CYMTET_48516 [Cymbomonas tetramitiformis]
MSGSRGSKGGTTIAKGSRNVKGLSDEQRLHIISYVYDAEGNTVDPHNHSLQNLRIQSSTLTKSHLNQLTIAIVLKNKDELLRRTEDLTGFELKKVQD